MLADSFRGIDSASGSVPGGPVWGRTGFAVTPALHALIVDLNGQCAGHMFELVRAGSTPVRDLGCVLDFQRYIARCLPQVREVACCWQWFSDACCWLTDPVTFRSLCLTPIRKSMTSLTRLSPPCSLQAAYLRIRRTAYLRIRRMLCIHMHGNLNPTTNQCALATSITYLSMGGSSFTTNHTGQIDTVDERYIAIPSVFRINDTCAGLLRNVLCFL